MDSSIRLGIESYYFGLITLKSHNIFHSNASLSECMSLSDGVTRLYLRIYLSPSTRVRAGGAAEAAAKGVQQGSAFSSLCPSQEALRPAE